MHQSDTLTGLCRCRCGRSCCCGSPLFYDAPPSLRKPSAAAERDTDAACGRLDLRLLRLARRPLPMSKAIIPLGVRSCVVGGSTERAGTSVVRGPQNDSRGPAPRGIGEGPDEFRAREPPRHDCRSNAHFTPACVWRIGISGGRPSCCAVLLRIGDCRARAPRWHSGE